MLRKLKSAAMLMPLVVAGAVFAVCAPASASCYSHAWSNKDPHDGYEYTLDYHCYVTNESGNTWTHVKVMNRDLYGWIYDAHLKGYGSPYRC